MPIRINLKELIGSDSQGVTVDKLNFNFNKLLELGVGTAGPKGSTGPGGSAGAPGGSGGPGPRGSLWYTGSGVPSAGPTPATPSAPPNPGGIGVLANDLYVDGDTGDQYDWDGTSWTIVTDLSAVVSSAVSTATSVAFVRDLDTAVTNTRHITFVNKASSTNDQIESTNTGNDMLFLNNFTESGVSGLLEQKLYSALLRITPDYSGGIENRRYNLQLGSYYEGTTPTVYHVSETKHDMKFRHVAHNTGTEIIYIGRVSMSAQENAASSEIDFNSMFEFIAAKDNETELKTRIGPKESISKFFTGAISNGITFDLNNANAEIGILEGYNIFGRTGEEHNYLVLRGDGAYDNLTSNTDAVLIKDKLVQDGGNIEQTGKGEFIEKSTVNTGQDITVSGVPQAYGNSAIAKIGNNIITIDGASSTTLGLIESNSALTGVLNVYDATDPSNMSKIFHDMGPYNSLDFNGIAASDMKILGNYAYIVNNISTRDYSGDTGGQIQDMSILDISKINRAFGGESIVSKIANTGDSLLTNENRKFHRIEIVGNTAIVSVQGLRSFGSNTIYSPNNTMFGSNSNVLYSIDVHNPDSGEITITKSSAVVDWQTSPLIGAGNRFQSLDLAVKGRYAYTMGLVFSDEGSNQLSYVQKILRLYIEDITNEDYWAVSNDMYASSTDINSTNHNAGTLSKFGSISISGKYLYSMYRSELIIFDIEKDDRGASQSIDRLFNQVYSVNFLLSEPDIRSMDSKISGNSLYILYSKAGASGEAYDNSGESGIVKMDLRNPINPVFVWKKVLSESNASRMTIDGNHIYVVCSGKNSLNKTIAVEIDGIVADNIDTGHITADKVQTVEVQTDSINAVAINSDKIHSKELSADFVNFAVPVGGVIMYTGQTVPGTGIYWNYIFCAGQQVADASGNVTMSCTRPDGKEIFVDKNLLLYFPKDASGNTVLPNLQNRFPLGSSLTSENADRGGSLKITKENLPSHKHESGDLNIKDPSFEEKKTSDHGAHQHFGVVGKPGSGGSTVVLTHKTEMDLAIGFNGFCEGSGSAVCNPVAIMESNQSGHRHASHTFQGDTGLTGDGDDYYPPYTMVNYIIRLV